MRPQAFAACCNEPVLLLGLQPCLIFGLRLCAELPPCTWVAVQSWPGFLVTKLAPARLSLTVACNASHNTAGLMSLLRPNLTRWSLIIRHPDEQITGWQLDLHSTQAQQPADQSSETHVPCRQSPEGTGSSEWRPWPDEGQAGGQGPA